MTTTTATATEPTDRAGLRRWGLGGVDLVFAAIVLASLVHRYRVTRGIWFWADDWGLALQARDLQGLVNPYNRHLSVVILSIYRVLLEVFGFSTYAPYRLVGLVCFASVAVALYLTARRRIGPTLAALAALIVLWPRGISLDPGGLNHSLALTGGIVCGWGLVGSGRRRDALVFVGLAFSLCSAGGGVAVAVAAIVHAACTRAGRTRWLAILGPTVVWAIWWKLTEQPEEWGTTAMRPGPADLVWSAAGQARRSFAYLALGNQTIGVILFVAFVAFGIWRLRQGLRESANVLAWSAALCFWWLGLQWSRPLIFTIAEGQFTFRYEFISIGFIILACLPVRDVPLPAVDRARRAVGPLGRHVVGPAAVALTALFLAWAVRPDVVRFAQRHRAFAEKDQVRIASTASPGQDPERVAIMRLRATDVRALFGQFTPPPRWDDTARAVGLASSMTIRAVPGESPTPCVALGEVTELPPETTIDLFAAAGADADPSTIEVRRFGSSWVPIGDLAPGQAATVRLLGLGIAEPWQVRAPQACTHEL